jgi:hypothetical protein
MPNWTTTEANGEVDIRLEADGPGSWEPKTVFQVRRASNPCPSRPLRDGLPLGLSEGTPGILVVGLWGGYVLGDGTHLIWSSGGTEGGLGRGLVVGGGRVHTTYPTGEAVSALSQCYT